MIPVAEAVRIITGQAQFLNSERVALDRALNRVLSEEVKADMDLPPFDRAQMDGYAVRAEDVREVPARLKIIGESVAGRRFAGEVRGGEAVRVMTGAPVPPGADAVQQVELTRDIDRATVEINQSVRVGRSIVARGSEIVRGVTALRAGEIITPAKMAVLAAFGYGEVAVGRRPRVTVIATGAELTAVGERPGPDQIRDSNGYSIAAEAERAGAVAERAAPAGDDLEELKRRIQAAAESADAVVLSGGVSMGLYDFTKAALRAVGAEIFFERVALRPGKPTVFAKLGETLIFGLPGNPVSVSVTFHLFVRPALLAMQGAADPLGARERAALARPVKASPDRVSYLPARIDVDETGRQKASPLRWGGSSDFVAFAGATALIVAPPGEGVLGEGEVVEVIRLA